jgi:hypothetical protein
MAGYEWYSGCHAPNITEVRKTVFNGFEYEITIGKPLKSLQLTLNYDENGSS